MHINHNGQYLEEYYVNDFDQEELEELIRQEELEEISRLVNEVEGDPSIQDKERCYPGIYDLILYERWARDEVDYNDYDHYYEDDISPEDIIRQIREA
jgi:hypothetical protein